jgi:tellurite methyltransferase
MRDRIREIVRCADESVRACVTTAELWNTRHAAAPEQQPLDFIQRLTPPGDKRKALDLAAGPGRHALLFANRNWQVTAVDISQTALDRISALDPKIQTVMADLEAGDFTIQPNSWDLICVSFYMQRDIFPALAQGLRTNGFLAAAFPLVDHRDGVRPMREEYLLAPGELRHVFEKDFEVLHYAEPTPAPPKRRTAELWAQRKS